jgi:hypothetical protein
MAAYALGRYAAVCAARGEHRRAARLLGATSTAPRAYDSFSWFALSAGAAEDLASTRRALGETEFAAAWAEGQAMSLESAVELALADGESTSPD